jgi:hypothetical protein
MEHWEKKYRELEKQNGIDAKTRVGIFIVIYIIILIVTAVVSSNI